MAVFVFQDLTGQKFSRLTALRYIGKSERTKKHSWLCECECGKKKEVIQHELIKNKVRSCGCLQKERIPRRTGKDAWNFKDLTGLKTHKLTVIDIREFKNGVSYWNCQCDCGRYTIVQGGALSGGNIKTCGKCSRKEFSLKAQDNPHFIDLTNQKMRNWQVIDFAYIKNQTAYWNCICDCGHKTTKSGALLRGEKHTHCCKCKNTKGENSPFLDNLVGKKFGKLLVLEYKERCNDKNFWICQCDCGNPELIITTSSALKQGKKSCGCLRKVPREDLTGKTFGNYLVIEWVQDFKKRKNGKMVGYWKCQCCCGKINYFHSTYLKSGDHKCLKCQGKKHSGPNHAFWNHEISQEEREQDKSRRFIPELKVWRKQVYERDNYTCQITGKRGQLAAHHIEAWATNKDLRFELSNGITLLESVHKLFHKMYGITGNTKEQLDNFIECIYNKEINIENLK